MRTRDVSVRALLTVGLCLVISASALAETVKARVLETNEKKSEARVDVAGQGRTYRVNNRNLYRVLLPGRLVIITAELVGGKHTIVDVQSADQWGRVIGMDAQRGTVTVQPSAGAPGETYYFDDAMRGLRMGDYITFEVEERGSRKVVARWSRSNSGSGNWGGSGGSNWSGSGGSGIVTDSGRVTGVDVQNARVTVRLRNGRTQAFNLAERGMLDVIRVGDDLTFDYEPRTYGNPKIVGLK